MPDRKQRAIAMILHVTTYCMVTGVISACFWAVEDRRSEKGRYWSGLLTEPIIQYLWQGDLLEKKIKKQKNEVSIQAKTPEEAGARRKLFQKSSFFNKSPCHKYSILRERRPISANIFIAIITMYDPRIRKPQKCIYLVPVWLKLRE